MLDKKEKRNKGIIFTLAFYIMTLIILIFSGFTTPLPLPEEEGIMIDFGDSETGLGLEEPQQSKTIVKPVEVPVQKESNMTQDYEESATTVPEVKVEEKVTKKVEVKEEPKEVIEEEKVDPLALYQNTADNSSNNSESEGVAGGKGNQGRPDGDPNSNQYTGNGSGQGGVGYSLRGRKPKGLPKPAYTSNEQGIVVVKIVVNREGKVVSAIPGVKGSTTLDSALLSAAKQAALNTKFDKKTSAPSKQTGTITYHFILK